VSPPLSPRKVACDHVYRKFPGLAGARPRMRKAGPNRVFTFSQTLKEGAGPALKQVVKVTVDAGGRVVKVVASR